MLREFGIGFRFLLRGFGFWRTHPNLMALGLVPAAIALLVLLAVLIPLSLTLGMLVEMATPFADEWISPWREILRVGIGIVVFVAALALAAAAFTALTLTIGDPFYQRIWRGVERSLGEEPTGETGFWATIGEGVRLVALGILIALVTLLIGLIPLVGGALAAVAGVLLTGRLLARELTGRAFDARGISGVSRSELLARGRSRVLGFGVATQLCFLVPLGAIIAMPAAVAGSTLLARSLLERAPESRTPPPSVSPPPAPGER